MLAAVITICFLFCLVIGVPISIALGIPSLLYLLWKDIPIQIAIQRTFGGIDNFTLLAIPFFMIAGNLMNEGGITERIVQFSKSMTGRIRGGFAMVNVIASMLFAGISGSAAADIASVGTVLIPAMKKDGYTAEYSVAVTAMSAIIGPIIPPSIVFILYGVLAQSSIIALFLAGIIPGILLGLAQITVIYFEAKYYKFPAGEPTNVKNFFNTMMRSMTALTLPVIIIGGLLSGIFTATEAGAVAALYAFVLAMFVYRLLKPKVLVAVIKETSLSTANVLFMVGTSTIFAWMLAAEQVPQKAAHLILFISQNPYVVLAIINILLLALGTTMDNFPAMIISIPVLLPIVEQIGISSLHFGVIMSVNLMMGAVTPPVGLGIYLASTVGDVTIERATIAVRWLFLASIAILGLISYVPSISLFIPNLLGYH